MKFFRPLDAVLILGVACLAVWSFHRFGVGEGARAVVTISNHKYGWYDLQAAPVEVDFPTQIGNVRARIGGGSARIVSSPCPNKLCVKHGAIHWNHDELICLPARLRISVEGDRDGDAEGAGKDKPAGGGVDAVTR